MRVRRCLFRCIESMIFGKRPSRLLRIDTRVDAFLENLMLASLVPLLQGVKALQFRIAWEGDARERLQVLLQTTLGEPPSQMSEEIEQARAVLATPLVLRGTLAEIDDALPGLIERFGAARAETHAAIADGVEALETAAKEAAANVKAKAAAKRAAKTTPKAVTKTPPKSAAKAAAAKPVSTQAVPTGKPERKKPGPKPKVKPVAPLSGVSAAEPPPVRQVQEQLFGDAPNEEAGLDLAVSALAGVAPAGAAPTSDDASVEGAS